jgi:restriction system protein
VFITTSTFTKEAREYADGVTPRVILVDGPMLARLMITHNVGVTVARRVEIKRVDLDYFASEEDEAGPSPEPDVSVE